jgi:hypothetical protein
MSEAFLLDQDTEAYQAEFDAVAEERRIRALILATCRDVFSSYGWGEMFTEDVEVLLAYIEMRQKGESHNIAKMCATGRTPALMTDAVWKEGQAQQPPVRRRGVHRRGVPPGGPAQRGRHHRQGVRLQLADYFGDPRAWVSSRAEMRQVILDRGWSSEGAVNVKGRPATSTRRTSRSTRP